jgi:hypothetical protein
MNGVAIAKEQGFPERGRPANKALWEALKRRPRPTIDELGPLIRASMNEWHLANPGLDPGNTPSPEFQ